MTGVKGRCASNLPLTTLLETGKTNGRDVRKRSNHSSFIATLIFHPMNSMAIHLLLVNRITSLFLRGSILNVLAPGP